MQKVKKMKKMRQILAGSVLAVLVAASPALAATAPVVFNGDALGSAELQGGRTYLPFRVIFEACGATVDWNTETKTVLAVQDGRVLTMQVGQKTVDVGGASYTLDAAPYVKNGRTYVPVRFVSETLGYDVIWDQDNRQVNITAPLLQYHDGDSHYSLNLKNGEIVLRQGTTHTVLGVCDIEKAGNYNFSSMQVSKTADGNYLADVDIWTSGAITVYSKLYTWMNADTGESYTVNGGESMSVSMGEHTYKTKAPMPLVGEDGSLWLCGKDAENKDVLYQIDDNGGKLLREWPVGDDIKAVQGGEHWNVPGGAVHYMIVEWADDKYMLFCNDTTMRWGLLDLVSGNVVDITDELLPDAVIDKMDEMSGLEIGRQGVHSFPILLDPFYEVSFVKEDKGVLHFEIVCRMLDPVNEPKIELEYQIK